MPKPRSRRRRDMLDDHMPSALAVPVTIDPQPHDVRSAEDTCASTPSYIRELAENDARDTIPTDPRIEIEVSRERVAITAAADPNIAGAIADSLAEAHAFLAMHQAAMDASSEPANDDERVAAAAPPQDLASTVSDEDSESDNDEVAPFDELALDHDDGVDALERHLSSGWRPSPKLRRNAMTAVAAVAIVAIGWSALHRGSHAHPVAVATHTMTASIAHNAPAPAAVQPTASATPVVPSAPAGPSAALPTTPAAALEQPAAPQPTEQLEHLLDSARRARSVGLHEATNAMQAWVDAGGRDAQPVAQFAYWLGRRGNVQLAEQWAERATTMDPNSQMAWYVLGATRLEDPRQRRANTVDALRHCAALPGVFAAECRGPLGQ